jgi:FkbM family methyltransferase
MTSTLIPGLQELTKYERINVVDVGAARAAFMVELNKLIKGWKIYSIGIDPIDRGFSNQYTKFYNACVDNVETPVKKDFFKNSKDDQASSLCSPPDDIADQFSNFGQVDVLNLNDIIIENIPDDVVHFIKIDAEGKDLDIVKSLSQSILDRTKFISIECPNSNPRFSEEFTKDQFIKYFESINFEVFYEYDTSTDPSNKSNLSDIIFINKKEL